MAKFQTEILALIESYKLMMGSLSHISQLYQDDPGFAVPFEIFANISKIHGAQSIMTEANLQKMNSLLKTHFEYQVHVLNQSIKPFLPKITQAELQHLQTLEKFLSKRQQVKEKIKGVGFTSLENSVRQKRILGFYDSPKHSPTRPTNQLSNLSPEELEKKKKESE